MSLRRSKQTNIAVEPLPISSGTNYFSADRNDEAVKRCPVLAMILVRPQDEMTFCFPKPCLFKTQNGADKRRKTGRPVGGDGGGGAFRSTVTGGRLLGSGERGRGVVGNSRRRKYRS
jgi:hypothetical protein